MQNPRKDWITRQDERLRIVSDELWDRAQEEQSDRSHRVGESISRGLSKAAALRVFAGKKYLLSGILRCSQCGSAYAIAGRGIYKCSGHTGGGAALCANDAVIRREEAEAGVLAGLKRQMSDPAVIAEICTRVRAAMRAPKPKPVNHGPRIAELRSQIDNIADAVASGAFRASPTLAGKLAAAEAELERLESQRVKPAAPVAEVTRLLADLPAHARRSVDQLEKTLASGDIPRARQEIKARVWTVTVEADAREIRLYGEADRSRPRYCGPPGALMQVSVVAGARCAHSLTGIEPASV